jgi:hypothetical protein
MKFIASGRNNGDKTRLSVARLEVVSVAPTRTKIRCITMVQANATASTVNLGAVKEKSKSLMAIAPR